MLIKVSEKADQNDAFYFVTICNRLETCYFTYQLFVLV